MGLLELLTVLFVTLKLLAVIDWSWWLVFAPMYVYVAAFIGYLVFVFGMALIVGATEAIGNNKKKKK